MNIAVLGAQWGDEGKGKIVDLLTPHFSIVARYQGGHNAGHTVYANGTQVRPAAAPVRHPARRHHLRHRQRRGRSTRRRCSPRSTSWPRAGIDVGNRLVDQRQGAPDPAVSPRAGPAQRSAARRAQDRHDVARHRAGLRGQDRAARRPRRRPRRIPPSLAEAVEHNVAARNRLIADSTMDAAQVLDGPAHGVGADAAVGDGRVAVPRARARRRDARSCSKARKARCSTSITAPIRT